MTPTFFLVRGYTNYFIGGHRRFLPFSGKSEKKVWCHWKAFFKLTFWTKLLRISSRKWKCVPTKPNLTPALESLL